MFLNGVIGSRLNSGASVTDRRTSRNYDGLASQWFAPMLARVTGETHFKGWAKPGPVPPGWSAGLTVAPDETLDA